MLAGLLNEEESRGPLRADFRRFYQHSVDEFRAMGVPLTEVADMAVNLPAESATHRALNPNWHHTHELELSRRIEHALSILVWRKGRQKSKDFPDPYMFPWEDDPNEAIKGDLMTTDEIDDWLGWSTPDNF